LLGSTSFHIIASYYSPLKTALGVQGGIVKSITIGVISFILGAAIAGCIGFKMFISLAQMGILTEMNAHSVSLDMISENKVDDLNKSNCFVLKVALENYAQFEQSFWSIDNARGTPEMTQEFLAKVKEQVKNTVLCPNT
tara:strand:+ start:173 stop:589 length:417 start_codon:yes stop_codon:yes gene_type:complete